MVRICIEWSIYVGGQYLNFNIEGLYSTVHICTEQSIYVGVQCLK